ncbi:Pyridoxal phosphate-dependent transferase major region subdomain 2 [Penicillium angulare]|uniref:Pyridoxal phosphate-dependent transferase major region subdomain 2 n=1 Tax=Penicillium angulare TaxID=116970 RepID=UPI00253F848D|nr:Pyridoxal phosphate-dependent transferase major region subdomain 2 [Penicillium angulare]KAJ5287762.1 Pyridoxal phosphate-dependent transferase major region subdomain 2 [Penicillium angulare]
MNATPSLPQSLQVGEPIPPDRQHVVSSSLPTWESVGALGAGEDWLISRLKAGYPRFYINSEIRGLSEAISKRLGLAAFEGVACLVLPSLPSAVRCLKALQEAGTLDGTVTSVQFSHPEKSSLEASWLEFYTIVYPVEHFRTALTYWTDSGDGISTRHAEFCLGWLDYLQSNSSNAAFCTSPVKKLTVKGEEIPKLQTSGILERDCIKQDIAVLLLSEKHGQVPVSPTDVFLYPSGMSAINAVGRTVSSLGINSGVVAFGLLYKETIKVLEHRWPDITIYKDGGDEDVNHLEASLKAGEQITALWIDVPSNPMLVTPDMPRLRRLADEYHFLVLVDDTVGTFANVDVLPYVDVLMTSLTKMYSGYCDVMGGSVVVNPQSPHHDRLHYQLTVSYEETFFPGDVAVLYSNSQDFLHRLQATNSNAEIVAAKLASHPAVERVYYPSLITKNHYDRIRRRDGGYGHLLSIVFRDNDTAIRFYDGVNIFKGPSFGMTFSILIAYAQLATKDKQPRQEELGVPSHLVRISIGMEDVDILLQTLFQAIKEAEIRD